MKIFRRIFEQPAFVDKPPVLMDIGASTEIHRKWRKIAPYCICIAFDPDSRQMEYIGGESGFKKMYVYPAIVHETLNGNADFYLTASPECSSTLEPRTQELNEYLFAPLFKVEEKTELKSVTLPKVLEELSLDYIDWFKTDTQGTDLRIFKSLPEAIRKKIIAVEFEPGIIDAYKDEDKLWNILQFMEHEPFWCCDLTILGNCRFRPELADKYFNGMQRKMLNTVLPQVAGWAEVFFMNDFSNEDLSRRELLLGWVISVLNEQFGEAMRLADLGINKFEDRIFSDMQCCILKIIKRRSLLSYNVFSKVVKKLKCILYKNGS